MYLFFVCFKITLTSYALPAAQVQTRIMTVIMSKERFNHVNLWSYKTLKACLQGACFKAARPPLVNIRAAFASATARSTLAKSKDRLLYRAGQEVHNQVGKFMRTCAVVPITDRLWPCFN